MSVFTPVDAGQCATWLARYDVGTLTDIIPIPEGIQNTNYFVNTDRGRYVLTLFEAIEPTDLRFYLQLLIHLASQGIPCPAPIAGKDGATLGTLNGKPAAIVTCLRGTSVFAPDARHCAAAGNLLARLHLAARSFAGRIDNPRGSQWCREAGTQLAPKLRRDEQALLREELLFQALFRLDDLPRGIVHGDAFRDNVLFDEDSAAGTPLVGGIIDFYLAGADALLFDLAVTANDWCLSEEGGLDPERTRALLQAYHAVRPLTAIERGAWPVLLRRTALRFWLSRLRDFFLRQGGPMTHVKDPGQFRDILRQRVDAGSNQPWV